MAYDKISTIRARLYDCLRYIQDGDTTALSRALDYIEDSHKPSPLLTKMKEEGKMGFKSGEGFYKWDDEKIAKCNADLNSYLIKMLYDK